MSHVGRTIEPPEVAKLVQVRPDYRQLLPPEAGFGELVQAIRSGKLDKYLHDWAPGAFQEDYPTILIYAIESNLPDVVAALLERGADPNRGVAQGAPNEHDLTRANTPLGVSGNSEEITRLLLSAGADVDKLSRGRAPLLLAANKKPGAIRAMLEAGADPLKRSGGAGDTPLSYLVRNPKEENLRIMKEAARKQMANKRRAPVSCKAGKNPKDPAKERGIHTFAVPWLDTPWVWRIVFVKADLDATSQALQRHYPGSELRQSPKTPIFVEDDRPIFLLRLAGMPWTVVFEELGNKSDDERMRKTAQALSQSLQTQAVCSGPWQGLLYTNGELIEEHDNDWYPEVIFDQLHEELPEDKVLSETRMCTIEKEQLQKMDAWFAQHDIYLPRAAYDYDGLAVRLELRGIKKTSVEGCNVVIEKPV